MTHLLDTHAWVQRAAGEPLPILVEETLREHAETLALADISICRYRSNSAARSGSVNAMADLICHGLNFEVCGTSPALCL